MAEDKTTQAVPLATPVARYGWKVLLGVFVVGGLLALADLMQCGVCRDVLESVHQLYLPAAVSATVVTPAG